MSRRFDGRFIQILAVALECCACHVTHSSGLDASVTVEPSIGDSATYADASQSVSASPAVAGHVAPAHAASGNVQLFDASDQAHEQVGINPDGGFALNVLSRIAPFLIIASWAGSDSIAHVQAGFALSPGPTNVTPLTDLAVIAASGETDRDALIHDIKPATIAKIASNWQSTWDVLLAKLKPLVDYYGGSDAQGGTLEAGMLEMFDVLRFDVLNGRVVISNPGTALQIFTANLNDIANGTLILVNVPSRRIKISDAGVMNHDAMVMSDAMVMPDSAVFNPPDGGPPPEGEALFSARCSGCHIVRPSDHDHSHGTIPNLASKGQLVAERYLPAQPGIGGGNAHATITLNAEQIDWLVRYANSFPPFEHAM